MTTNSHAAPWTFRRFLAMFTDKPAPHLRRDIRLLTRRDAASTPSIPDLLVLRHWGYTEAEWNALPAIVKADKREHFYQALGWLRERALRQAKRLTDAELAAEWHYQDNRCGQKLEGYGVSHDGSSMGSEDDEIEKLRIAYRFATLPHYDEVDQ